MSPAPDTKKEKLKSPFENLDGLLKRRAFTPEEQVMNTNFTRLLRVYAASYLFYFLIHCAAQFGNPNFFSHCIGYLYRTIPDSFALLTHPLTFMASFFPALILPVLFWNLYPAVCLTLFLIFTMALARSKLNQKRILLAYRIFFYSGIAFSILYGLYLNKLLENPPA